MYVGALAGGSHIAVMEEGNDLKWEGYGNRMLQNLFNMKEHETLCDLTLVAENESYHVHRAVMASSSDYFKALLTLDMKEKGQRLVHLKGKTFVLHHRTGRVECSKYTWNG